MLTSAVAGLTLLAVIVYAALRIAGDADERQERANAERLPDWDED